MYYLTKSKISDEDGNIFDTYGISCNEITVEDISTNKNSIERLVGLCNELDLSPTQLNDVVEDFMVDNKI